MLSALRDRPARRDTGESDVCRIRSHFEFASLGRVATNNAASTQPPRELLTLMSELTRSYENVHRGQSAASQRTTELFEASYDTFAQWLNAPSRRNIATYRNTTEAINAVMYSLLTEFRHAAGAQLELRSLVRHVPRDPASLRASGRVPRRPVRPRHR
jgi:selenocysteine lyase/cysteine desulfurase